jgi:GNAT superfamily N-acetyltransferase
MKHQYIDLPYGPSQLYLETLGTHPDFQRRGAGTRLVSRGIEVGKREGVNVTLIAQPTAEGFYRGLGFVSVRNVTVSRVGEGDEEREGEEEGEEGKGDEEGEGEGKGGFRFVVMRYGFGEDESGAS